MDMDFPFICAFVDNASGYIADDELKNVNSVSSELVVEILGTRWSVLRDLNEWMVSLKKHFKELKEKQFSWPNTIVEHNCLP